NINRYETVYRHKDRSSIEISLTASPIRDANGGITRASKIAHDISERKEAERRQPVLTNELAHPSRNPLAVVQSIVSHSLTGTRPLTEVREVLAQRIQALARSQSILIEGGFEGAPLAEIIRLEFKAFSDQVKAAGPVVMLNPRTAQTFALL